MKFPWKHGCAGRTGAGLLRCGRSTYDWASIQPDSVMLRARLWKGWVSGYNGPRGDQITRGVKSILLNISFEVDVLYIFS